MEGSLANDTLISVSSAIDITSASMPQPSMQAALTPPLFSSVANSQPGEIASDALLRDIRGGGLGGDQPQLDFANASGIPASASPFADLAAVMRPGASRGGEAASIPVAGTFSAR